MSRKAPSAKAKLAAARAPRAESVPPVATLTVPTVPAPK